MREGLAQVLARLSALGLRFERQDARLATRMAFGMFDTDASFRCASSALGATGACFLQAAVCRDPLTPPSV